MKNHLIWLFLAIVVSGSCSTDSPEEDNLGSCENEVWGMSLFESNDEVKYEIEYGPSEFNTVTVQVNKATYEYYSVIVEDDNPKDCWEGLK